MIAFFRNLKIEQLRTVVACVCGLITCVAAGLLIGSADFTALKRVGFLLAFLAYALIWQPYTWQIALAIALVGFTHIGFGFRISTVEMSGAVAAMLIGLTWWKKNQVVRPDVLRTPSFSIFNLALLIWLVYSGGHAMYTILDPFNPYEFALKNFLKSLVGLSGPLVLIFYFLHRPRGIVANDNMLRPVVIIGFFALVINLLMRIWGLNHGAINPDIAAQIGDENGYFVIPGFDLTEDPFALRTLTPFTATTCAVLIGSKWLHRRSLVFHGLLILTLLLSFVGATMSGGRATLVFVFGLTAVALWMRGHYQLVVRAFIAGALVVVALNLTPGILRKMPPVLQRSLQMIVVTEESEWAQSSIKSSSDWRLELFQRAIAEWRSDPRIFWFGRGTYKFGNEDIIARAINTGRGDMEISLRRGTTHSLVSDLLVVYGVCGFVCFFFLIGAMLWHLWRLYHEPLLNETPRLVTLICFLLLAFNFGYGIFGGAIFPIHVAWLLIALYGYFFHQSAFARDTATRESIDPAEARSLASPRAKSLRPIPRPLETASFQSFVRRPTFGHGGGRRG